MEQKISTTVKSDISNMKELIEKLMCVRKKQNANINCLVDLLATSNASTCRVISRLVATQKNKPTAPSPAENQTATPIEKKKKKEDTAP